MPTRISDALGISHGQLDAQGALDGFVDIDSHFHIHPGLLANPIVPELTGSHERFEKHFRSIILILDAAKSADSRDVFFRQAIDKLIFPEISLAAIGFAKESTRGRAIGKKLAKQVAQTAFQIVKAGIKEPAIFELIGLFEEGIGADLISDMSLALIIADILAFNDRVADRLRLSRIRTEIGWQMFDLPCTKDGSPVLLLPREILSPLPIAATWDDFSTVANYNEKVRNEINRRVGKTWGTASRTLHKKEIKEQLLANPDLLRDLLAQYKGNPPQKYDYVNDPLGELIWFDAAKEFAERFPLELKTFNPSDHDTVVRTVVDICNHFKRLVEANGLVKLFYDQDGNLKPEKAAQLLFYGIADAYCCANNLDISAESNAGRGPVDFKVSKGYHSRLNVEVKYSNNPKLLAGYEKQLPTYDEAEKSFESIYLVIDTGTAATKLRNLLTLRANQIAAGKRAPKIITVDGTIQLSASKLI